ncbi:peroxidase P7-like [Chenopodium quinoa]|uniref:Peroxidase n=1 Tax=Chenopodium quinoa TaxID=63459 RepID=A0A803M434_CHEQI|nr:peroxidase P7-like [Chenopodium quinoa]
MALSYYSYYSMASFKCFIACISVLIILSLSSNVEARSKEQLSIDYYYYTCPKVLDIVRDTVVEAIKNETRTGASLLRLHFHDCFVNGCDGSVLLDDNATFTGEKNAFPNSNSLRAFDVVDVIKARLEKACPLIVSCADILAIAARDSVYHLGGPTWDVRLGRRDSLTANLTAANVFIPAPSSNITLLKSNFADVGLSFKDLVSLSGAHTIGFARCTTFRSRIYNDRDISPPFAQKLRGECPPVGNDDVLQGLDLKTPSHFDNLYYKNLLTKKGLLHSDQEIYNSNKADPIVRKYSRDVSKFYRDFSKGMIKMSEISPLLGNEGEIRQNCRVAR